LRRCGIAWSSNLSCQIEHALPPSALPSADRMVIMITRRMFAVNCQPDGSWTIASQPPLPSVTTFITNGWKDVEFYRNRWNAVDWFPNSADYPKFCQEFGEPQFEREIGNE
jgi:hypothetical protein